MEVQGNILKTLLIAAVIYTLALGAPVKRQTISSIVAEACAAAKNTTKIVADCSSTPTLTTPTYTYNESDAAAYLRKGLLENKFTGAVCEAVRKCLNHRDYEPKKCKLAAAAMELHDTVNKFIAKYETNDTQTLPINCSCTSTDEVEVEGPLCYASRYTRVILAGIDGRQTPICF